MQTALASNGQETCTVHGVRLHSAYNPQKEAQRFADSLSCPFSPRYIIVTEPALSYCVPYLKNRFCGAVTLCCIRYSASFSKTDALWDKVFNAFETTSRPLSEQLYAFLGEEGINATLFASWKPSEKAFETQSAAVWSEIKKAVVKSQTVLATRHYFTERWAKNTVRFCLFAQKILFLKEKGNCPILICASGLSLKTSIPYIKRYRAHFFLLAVSSALRPLVEYGIFPDLCISTDGGFWAKLHLSFALQALPTVPLALSSEAALYTRFIQNQPVVCLSYPDSVYNPLLANFSYPLTPAERNGTVSGTAARLALDITDGNVFFCGLDLKNNAGFSHTQPNELELYAAKNDYRLAPQETRLAPSSFFSETLEIYREWFASQHFGGRLFRLSDNGVYNNSLNEVQDVNWQFFANEITTCGKKRPVFEGAVCNKTRDERTQQLLHSLDGYIKSTAWHTEVLPSQMISLERCKDEAQKEEIRKIIEKKMAAFKGSLLRALGMFEI